MAMQMSTHTTSNTTSGPLCSFGRSGFMAGIASTPEFLVFRLGAEQFGVDFQYVEEIRHYSEPMPVSNVPGDIKGLLFFKGRLTPVVDMRLKLGLEPCVRDSLTDIIFVNLGERPVGLLVDGVDSVVNLGGQTLRPARDFMSVVDSDQILAIAQSNGRTLTLLDIEKLLRCPEIALI